MQHLEFLTDRERAVFKTATEVDMIWVIRQAAARQKWIDQGQSVNLFFPPKPDRAYVNRIHMEAWRQGLKALYYLRAKTSATAEAVSSEVKREKLMDASERATPGARGPFFTDKHGRPVPDVGEDLAAVNPVANTADSDECVACQG